MAKTPSFVLRVAQSYNFRYEYWVYTKVSFKTVFLSGFYLC